MDHNYFFSKILRWLVADQKRKQRECTIYITTCTQSHRVSAGLSFRDRTYAHVGFEIQVRVYDEVLEWEWHVACGRCKAAIDPDLQFGLQGWTDRLAWTHRPLTCFLSGSKVGEKTRSRSINSSLVFRSLHTSSTRHPVRVCRNGIL